MRTPILFFNDRDLFVFNCLRKTVLGFFVGVFNLFFDFIGEGVDDGRRFFLFFFHFEWLNFKNFIFEERTSNFRFIGDIWFLLTIAVGFIDKFSAFHQQLRGGEEILVISFVGGQ